MLSLPVFAVFAGLIRTVSNYLNRPFSRHPQQQAWLTPKDGSPQGRGASSLGLLGGSAGWTTHMDEVRVPHQVCVSTIDV
jgi:hypothetical protein